MQIHRPCQLINITFHPLLSEKFLMISNLDTEGVKDWENPKRTEFMRIFVVIYFNYQAHGDLQRK